MRLVPLALLTIVALVDLVAEGDVSLLYAVPVALALFALAALLARGW